MAREIKNFNEILSSLNVDALCIKSETLDNYKYFDIKLSNNTKVKDIEKLNDEISLLLKSSNKFSIKKLYSEGLVRVEFVSKKDSKLNLFDYFTNENIPKAEIPCLLGQFINGKRVWMDLADNPHMIVAGTTSSGKSTLLHTIIANLLNYNNVDLFLVDPKNIEFSLYSNYFNNIKVCNTYNDTIVLLDKLIAEMEERFSLLRDGYNKDKIKYSVVIIDEFADLIMQDNDKLLFSKLLRLAQKCRAAKINIILATQRPSVGVVNGMIKANFPARISCRVASSIDSKIILDSKGAENLNGKGDALLRDNSRLLERFQVAYTSANEICSIFGNK